MNTLPNKLFKRSAVLALLFALLFCIGCNTVTMPNGTSETYGNRLMLATNNMDGELISDGAIDPPDFADGNYYTHYIGCVDDTMYFMFVVYPQSNGQISFSPQQESIAAFNTETLEWSLVFDDRE